jgi:hypothetical protein
MKAEVEHGSKAPVDHDTMWPPNIVRSITEHMGDIGGAI